NWLNHSSLAAFGPPAHGWIRPGDRLQPSVCTHQDSCTPRSSRATALADPSHKTRGRRWMQKNHLVQLGLVLMVGLMSGCGGPNEGAPTCMKSTCPQTGASYQFCVSPGATSCHYVTGNSSIQCHSCTDCGAAVIQVSNWCAGSSATQ